MNHIARFQVLRRFHPQADARRRSRADHVSWQKSHEFADVSDQRRNIENHLGGGTSLPELSIHLQPHAQLVKISNFIFRGEERPQRRERIRALSFYPLPSAFKLEAALR